jgi:predicted amidohydrolase
MFVLGCNRVGTDTSLKNDEPLPFPGDSRIVDPMGELIASAAGEVGPLMAQIDLRKVRTIRRILPVRKDQRPDVYRQLWEETWRVAGRRNAARAPKKRPT